MGRTNSILKGNELPAGNKWEDLKSLTLNNPASAPTEYEITIPPAVTEISLLFTPSNLRGCDLIIHNEGSAITKINQAFRYMTSRTITLDFDTSEISSWESCFSRAGAGSAPVALTINGVLDFSGAMNIRYMFTDWVYNSEYVSSFRLAPESLAISWDLGNCNPDNDTINSIIAGLADMTGEEALTLTMNTNVKARLTETQTAAITAKNWNLA